MTACGGGGHRDRVYSPSPSDPRLLYTTSEATFSHTAEPTEDGQKVIKAGGYTDNLEISQNVAAIDVYARDTLDVAGSPVTEDMFEPRALHTQTRVEGPGGSHVPRGSMLIVGGQSKDSFRGPYVSDTIDVYDPSSDRFKSSLGNLRTPRKNHTVTEITDPASFYEGQFIVIGGQDNNGNILDTAELFNPVTGGFTYIASRLNTAREEHTATALKNGGILIAGGNTRFGATDTGEIFDVVTLSFAYVQNRMSNARRYHTATYLDNKTPTNTADDAALLAGGLDERGFTYSSADFYDPFVGRFIPVNSYLPYGVFRHAAVALPYSVSGDVAITGGFTSLSLSNPLRSDPTEQVIIFNYTYTGNMPDGYFVRTTNMLRARALHTTNHVKSRTLLTIGGVNDFGDPRSTVEEFNY